MKPGSINPKRFTPEASYLAVVYTVAVIEYVNLMVILHILRHLRKDDQ